MGFEQILKYVMILVLVVGVIATFSWQYLLYKKLKGTGKKTTLNNIRSLPNDDNARNKILKLKKIGDFGIGAYLIWFVTTLILNLMRNN